MATTNDQDFVFHLHPGKSGPRTKRVSFLIGSHQPIGAVRTKRVSSFWMAVIGFLAVAVIMAVKDLIYEDIYGHS